MGQKDKWTVSFDHSLARMNSVTPQAFAFTFFELLQRSFKFWWPYCGESNRSFFHVLGKNLVVAVGVFVPMLALAEPGPLRGACISDVKALCGSIQPGGGRIRDCMKEHRAELSAACKTAIADRMLERGRSQSTGTSPQ